MPKETPSKAAADALSDLEIKDSKSNLNKELRHWERKTE